MRAPVILEPPFVTAQSAIDDKHNALGGDAGLLGGAIEDMKPAPDGTGFFRRYANGMIYWSPSTGAHEIHGAILDKWSALGFERSYVGYAKSDVAFTASTFKRGTIITIPFPFGLTQVIDVPNIHQPPFESGNLTTSDGLPLNGFLNLEVKSNG